MSLSTPCRLPPPMAQVLLQLTASRKPCLNAPSCLGLMGLVCWVPTTEMMKSGSGIFHLCSTIDTASEGCKSLQHPKHPRNFQNVQETFKTSEKHSKHPRSIKNIRNIDKTETAQVGAISKAQK